MRRMILATCLGLIAIGCSTTADQTASRSPAPEATATPAADPSPTAVAVAPTAAAPTPIPAPASTPEPARLPAAVPAPQLDVPVWPPTGAASRYGSVKDFCGDVMAEYERSVSNFAQSADLVVSATVAGVTEGRGFARPDRPHSGWFGQMLLLDDVLVVQGEAPEGPLLVEVEICGVAEAETNGNVSALPAREAADHAPADTVAVWFLWESGHLGGSDRPLVIDPASPWSDGEPLYRPLLAGIFYVAESGEVVTSDQSLIRSEGFGSTEGYDDALVYVLDELEKPLVERFCIGNWERYLDDVAYDDATAASIREQLDPDCVTRRDLAALTSQYPQMLAKPEYGCAELAIETGPDMTWASHREATSAFAEPWRQAFGGRWRTGPEQVVLQEDDGQFLRIMEAWVAETPAGWVIERFQHCVGVSP